MFLLSEWSSLGGGGQGGQRRAASAANRVAHEHGDGHGPDTSRHRRDERGHILAALELDVAHEAVACGVGWGRGGWGCVMRRRYNNA